jgi:hypothetical protein
MDTPSPGDTLTLRLDAAAEDVCEPEFVSDAPLLRFEAFLPQWRLFGSVRLAADRLTDLLNAHAELQLHEATFESLVDGSTREAESVVVPRSSLVGVVVTGPRGDPALRRWTHSHAAVVQLGDFLMGGYAHVPPDDDPLATIRGRPSMVPLTDARLEYWPGGQHRRTWIGTMIFNRDLADWIRIVSDSELELGLIRPRRIAPA